MGWKTAAQRRATRMAGVFLKDSRLQFRTLRCVAYYRKTATKPPPPSNKLPSNSTPSYCVVYYVFVFDTMLCVVLYCIRTYVVLLSQIKYYKYIKKLLSDLYSVVREWQDETGSPNSWGAIPLPTFVRLCGTGLWIHERVHWPVNPWTRRFRYVRM